MQPVVTPEIPDRQAEQIKRPPLQPTASSAPRLRDRLFQQIRTEGKSPRTAEAYWHWCAGFIRFHKMRHPQEMGADEVRAYLNWLANDRQLAQSSHGQALHGLLYLYRNVLGIRLPWLNDLVAPKRPKHLPVVLNEAEIRQLWPHLRGTTGLILKLMYGTGLLVMEALRLRVQDLDLEAGAITVRDGKGSKDRVTMVPQKLLPALRAHLAVRAEWHAQDLITGHADVELPNALHRKYPHAGRQMGWQWVFATADYNNGPNGEIRRHHVHDSSVQKAMKAAVRAAGIHKHATPHTMRHSFATHLLRSGTDIRTVQELLGHNSVETTMVYTHVLQRAGRGVISPLDSAGLE